MTPNGMLLIVSVFPEKKIQQTSNFHSIIGHSVTFISTIMC